MNFLVPKKIFHKIFETGNLYLFAEKAVKSDWTDKKKKKRGNYQ